MITIKEAKKIIDKVTPEHLSSNYGFLIDFFRSIYLSTCKESGAKFYAGYLMVGYKHGQELDESFERFLSLCKLLKMPLKTSEFETFKYRDYTWYILGGWCDKNSINREVARFLIKCTLKTNFNSIESFCTNHYLVGHYQILDSEQFNRIFNQFFTNLRGNLYFNRGLGVEGLITYINNGSLKIKPKSVT